MRNRRPENLPTREHCCRCSKPIDPPVTVVEVSRRTARGQESDRYLLCQACGQKVIEHLSRHRAARSNGCTKCHETT